MPINMTEDDVRTGRVTSRDLDPISQPDLYGLAKELEAQEEVVSSSKDQGSSDKEPQLPEDSSASVEA